MAKVKTRYVCQSCGAESPRWLGRCPECEAWNSLVEECAPSAHAPQDVTAGRLPVPLRLGEVAVTEEVRMGCAFSEFDRVVGGGLVPGSLVLLGGDPGVGKSTLLLQVAYSLAQTGKSVLYVTGEESAQQVLMRTARLGMRDADHFRLLAENNLDTVVALLQEIRPDFAVIDSIQAIYSPSLASAPGSVAQIRHGTNLLLPVAKQNGIALGLVGHVNKEGNLAGPRVLEHMVDTVLYFEGERFRSHRLLRSVKNRFGATHEVGVFEMVQAGLAEVTNPSALFLAEYEAEATGSVVTATVEGTRPLLVEVQALAYPSPLSSPRRAATGGEYNRLVQILAVLEKRVGLPLSKHDVWLNVVGGLEVEEPAADLAIALAVISSMRDLPLPGRTLVLGEVGLGGEVRGISQLEVRLHEAAKLGFERAIVPKRNLPLSRPIAGLEVIGVERVLEALVYLRNQSHSQSDV